MSSEETRTNGSPAGANETANVVRIPRDWFGPKDDLVPFGPGAWSGADGPPGDGRDAVRDAEAPLDAEAFWGEDAGALHDVLDEHPGAITARSTRRGDRRMLMAAVAVLLMASAGLSLWLVRSPQRDAATPPVAAIRFAPRPTPHLLPAKTAEIGRTARRGIRSRPRGVRHRSIARSSGVTQVVYRPVQATTPPAPIPTPSAPVTTSSDHPSGPNAGSYTAAAASSSQGSQPAYGANGALGPMSSPAG